MTTAYDSTSSVVGATDSVKVIQTTVVFYDYDANHSHLLYYGTSSKVINPFLGIVGYNITSITKF